MSATDPEKPERKKPGPKPDRLVIDPEDAGNVLDHLLGKPKGSDKESDHEGDEAEEKRSE